MKTKAIAGSVLLVALLAGVMLGGYFESKSKPHASDLAAFLPANENAMAVTCEDGQAVVTPVIRDGQKRLEVTCSHTGGVANVSPAVYRGEAIPVRDVAVRQPVYYRDTPRYRRHRRSWEREALIIGGSAGAGTGIGAIAGGKKGAAIGAATGGVAGLIYDLATRNK